MADEREILTWERFGPASRELAQHVADDGYIPEMILSIARGGLLVGGALGYALRVKKSRSLVKCDYVWRRTDRWLDFPWSDRKPVVPGLAAARES